MIENPTNMDDLGVPLFQETTIYNLKYTMASISQLFQGIAAYKGQDIYGCRCLFSPVQGVWVVLTSVHWLGISTMPFISL